MCGPFPVDAPVNRTVRPHRFFMTCVRESGRLHSVLSDERPGERSAFALGQPGAGSWLPTTLAADAVLMQLVDVPYMLLTIALMAELLERRRDEGERLGLQAHLLAI